MIKKTTFNYFIAVLLLLLPMISKAQDSLRVLFIGNSYTYTNDLPNIIKNLAVSGGDTLIHQSSAPGGYTFQQHSSNSTTLALIQQGNWDYVVLQEQSQLPSFPDSDVETYTYPYAHILDSMIKVYSPCAETVFFMTWGRQNGDASNCATWPPVCTYAGMDSLLHLRYRNMADNNAATLAPAGAVWRYIRQQWPTFNLYSPDGSHPSAAGSFAAACAFYAVLYRKDPLLCSYNFGLATADADSIKMAAHRIVFDSLLYWNVGEYDPMANFGFEQGSSNFEMLFSDSSQFADSYFWDFGDGNTATTAAPTHTYSAVGNYDVTLIVGSCGRFDTLVKQLIISAPSANDGVFLNADFSIYPNPCVEQLTLAQHICSEGQWVLYNNLGQLLYLMPVAGQQIQRLDLSGQAPGIYHLSLFDEKGIRKASKTFEKIRP